MRKVGAQEEHRCEDIERQVASGFSFNPVVVIWTLSVTRTVAMARFMG